MKRAKKYIERYAVELGVLATIFLSTVNFIFGRIMNGRLAFSWLTNVQKILHSSFAYVPAECKSLDEETIETFQDYSSSEYPISLSGRESCKYASFILQTRPRHDIATTIFTQLPLISRLFDASRDTLWVEIPIERTTKVHSEILLVQMKEVEIVKKAQPHLGVIMKPVRPNTVNEKSQLARCLQCLAENQESVDVLFSDPQICAVLSDPEVAQHLITVHITDQKLYNNFDLTLKAQIHANSKALPHQAKIVKFLIYLADWLSAKYKLPHTVQDRTL